MSLTQALIAQTLAVTSPSLLTAHRRASAVIDCGYAVRPARLAVHVETSLRRRHRALLDGAALAGASVQLAFLKLDGSLRYMQAEPCESADATCRYYTVLDLELSEEAGRPVHRRVCLDTLVGVKIHFQAALA